MNEDKYSDEELRSILNESVSEFRKLLKEGSDCSKHLPDPDKFRYLHEFDGFDLKNGGILIVGLNPHIGKNENEEVWRNKYCIDNVRNTSNCLLREYSYFKKFTEKSDKNEESKKDYNMDLLSLNSNVKFTDVVLIRSASKNDLEKMLIEKPDKKDDSNLQEAIKVGWKYYLSRVLKLVKPKVMVCNSVDLSRFLEEEYKKENRNGNYDIIDIDLGDFSLPCVLSGQVTGQRATDKWTLIRMRKAIELSLRNK